eukprot:gene31666-6867_t
MLLTSKNSEIALCFTGASAVDGLYFTDAKEREVAQKWGKYARQELPAAQTWIRLNPTWNVELISAATLHHYVQIPYIHNPDIASAAKSDIIRLSLLAKHGGVWADASLMCWAPLDDWVYEALRPTGYFMFQFLSWFHVNVKQSIPMQRWKRATDEYWNDVISKSLRVTEYNWMDCLMRHGLLYQKEVSDMAKKFRTKPVHWSFEYSDEVNKTIEAQNHMDVYRPRTCSHFGHGSENMTAYVGKDWSNVLILDRCSFCSRFPANVTCRPELDEKAPLRDSWIGWS